MKIRYPPAGGEEVLEGGIFASREDGENIQYCDIEFRSVIGRQGKGFGRELLFCRLDWTAE
jgi:hypothetical protein